jgi:nucleotide-binding universal stress UspA family protein
MAGYKRILVPVDGSTPSNAGLAEALRLAPKGASIRLVHVVEDPVYAYGSADFMLDYGELFEIMRADGKRILEKASRTAARKGVKAQTELAESRGRRVADAIVAAARRWKADAIVMGSHGRRGVSRVLLGSDAELVLRNTNLPLLLARPRRAAAR